MNQEITLDNKALLILMIKVQTVAAFPLLLMSIQAEMAACMLVQRIHMN
jgi:hypothetical protein